MPVGKFVQPNYPADGGAQYPVNIDAAISVLARMGAAFAPHEQDVPDMTVRLDAGSIFDASTLLEKAAQSTGVIVAPAADPRIDRVVIDQLTGAMLVVAGAEDAAPTPPAIPSAKVPVCQILLQTASAEITNSMITDERSLGSLGLGSMLVPRGSVMAMTGSTVPSGYLHMNGSNISMTTYQALYDYFGSAIYGLNTGVAFTADSGTDTLTSAAHGLSDDRVIEGSNSGGALPAGLLADTKYFVINSTVNTFQVSITEGGAAVDITDAGTGTHSWHNQFSLPDTRGEFLRGWDNAAGVDPDAASRTDRGDGTTGDNVGTKQDHGINNHQHKLNAASGSDSNSWGLASIINMGMGTKGGSSSEGTWREYIGDSDVNNPYIKEGTVGNFTTETRPINTTVMLCVKY